MWVGWDCQSHLVSWIPISIFIQDAHRQGTSLVKHMILLKVQTRILYTKNILVNLYKYFQFVPQIKLKTTKTQYITKEQFNSNLKLKENKNHVFFRSGKSLIGLTLSSLVSDLLSDIIKKVFNSSANKQLKYTKFYFQWCNCKFH